MISTNNYNKTSFGMSVKVGKDAMGIITEELTPKAAKKFAKISETQKNNPVDILVGTTPTGTLKVGTAGNLEKELNLKIALYLKEILENQNIKVIMTRTEDKDLSTTSTNFKVSDMKERIALIRKNDADLVISIHQNSYTSADIYGAQCFYHTNSTEGKELASIIQNQIITSTNQTKIREIKGNNDYYLLKHSPIPTVIVECGFLSNPEEEKLLLTEEYQRKMAWAIHLGILQYLNRATPHQGRPVLP